MILSYYYFKLAYFGQASSSQTEKENEGVEKKFFFFGVVWAKKKTKKTPKTITATAAEATALQLQGYRVPLKN